MVLFTLSVLSGYFLVLFFCIIWYVLCKRRNSRHSVDRVTSRVVPPYPPYPVVALHPQPQSYDVSPLSKFVLTQRTGDYKNTPYSVMKTNPPAPDGNYPPAMSASAPYPTTSSADPCTTAAPYSRTGPSTCPLEEDPPSYFEAVGQSSAQSPY